MEFAALEIFTAVVDEGGVSAAARKLNRVQSNVTTRIQQLERSLGTALFLRERRRLVLSPTGEVFLGYARRILETCEEARSAVHGDEPRGVLRVGTLESTAASRLPALLTEYHRRFPRVRVELTTGTSDGLIQALRRREIEAAFVADAPRDPAFSRLRAFDEMLALIFPTGADPFEGTDAPTVDTIIAFPVGCAYRRRLQSWLISSGITATRVLELSSYHAIVACVASGAGLALIPRSVLATLRSSRGIRVRDLDGPAGRSRTALVSHRGNASPRLGGMVELVRQRRRDESRMSRDSIRR